MTIVYKYPFPMQDGIVLQLPTGAEILHVEAQMEQPCMWARVDPAQPLVARHFRIAGTGHPLDENVGLHVGSFFLAGGTLVFHLFEQLK